jgi:hypothetical protein
MIVGLTGFLAGFCVFLATGKASLGLVALAAVWFFWGRRKSMLSDTPTLPSIYFIPLRYAALVVCLLALGLAAAEHARAQQPPNHLREMLKRDEAILRDSLLSGSHELAREVQAALSPLLGECSVRARVEPHAVLVLARHPKLKEFEASRLGVLLEEMERVVRAQPALKDRPLYLGVRGRLMYGAVQAPGRSAQTGTLLGEELEPFYVPYGSAGVDDILGPARTTSVPSVVSRN